VTFGGRIEGVPNQREKIQKPENFSPEGPKWGMENAAFFNILAPMGKMRNIVYKGALKL
jgi:hypothetical protein